MRKLVALLYIFAFILTSCEEEVDYKDMGIKNIIVVNGRFIDGETPWCQVSRSEILFDQIHDKIKPTVFLPNSDVTAETDNQTFKYVVIGDSAKMKANGLVARAGETYTIKASANGFENVYSTVRIPEKPIAEFKFTGFEIKEYNDFFYGPSVFANYELEIQDDPNSEDYYHFQICGKHMEYISDYVTIDTIYGNWWNDIWYDYYNIRKDWIAVDSFITYGPMEYVWSSNDPVMNWNKNPSEGDDMLFTNYERNIHHIFNDMMFNGQTSKIRFCVNVTDDIWGNSIKKADSINVEIHHINKETYMYLRTIENVADNEWIGSLSPYMLYCNVEHGAGLVAAWSKKSIPLVIPEIPENIIKRLKELQNQYYDYVW